MILIQHADFWLMGYPQEHTLRAFGACTIEGFSIIAVNVFVLISGYFGIKFNGIKILNLLFQCLFAVLPLSIFALVIDKGSVLSNNSIYELLFPFRYWYVTAYIGLIILSPVLNTFIENTDKKKLLSVIILLSVLAFIFDTVFRETAEGVGFNGGYSTLWMVNLYFIGRFLKLYPLQKVTKKVATWVVFGYVILQGLLLFFHLTGTRYTNPLLLIGSIAFFLFFTHFSFSSKKVNWIAGSALMAYLFSMHPVVIKIYASYLHQFDANHSLPVFLMLATILILAIFTVAILYDKIRIVVWKWIEPLCHKIVNITNKLVEKCYSIIK